MDATDAIDSTDAIDAIDLTNPIDAMDTIDLKGKTTTGLLWGTQKYRDLEKKLFFQKFSYF